MPQTVDDTEVSFMMHEFKESCQNWNFVRIGGCKSWICIVKVECCQNQKLSGLKAVQVGNLSELDIRVVNC